MTRVGYYLPVVTSIVAVSVVPSRPQVSQQHGYVHAGATSAVGTVSTSGRTLTVCQLDDLKPSPVRPPRADDVV